MANEIEFIAQDPTATHYVHVYDPAQGGAARNVTDGQWDADEDGTWSKYTVAATRVGSTSRFRASLPSGTDAAVMYDFQAFEQAGGSEANSDSPVYFATYIPGNVPANLNAIGDDTQSATDLKDFADAGYDPSTNKVQGVVLVDTTTTNTDMRGTDSAATAANLTTLSNTVGVAGAGLTAAGGDGSQLTAINLPNQTMDITGNITGNLSGSVGSVSGAVGSVTGAVGSVTGAVGSVTAGVTLANDAITAAKFDESTAFPLTSADSGSTAVARTGADSDTLETLSDEIAAISSPSAASIADAVLDEAMSGHTTAGTLGKAVADILDDTDLIDDGTSGLAKIATDVAAILADTGTDGVIVASFTTAAKAELQQEATDALTAYDPPTRTEATSDKDEIITQGDSAWATATGFSTHSAANVRTEMDANSTQLAAIVADTNELQTNQGNWLTATGFSTFNPGSDTVTAGAVSDKTGYSLTTAYDVYHADIKLNIDEANTQDEYTITWFKNGVRVTSGITSPTLQVVKRSDGTDLIASTTPTQIASTGSYKHDATTTARMTAGQDALAVVTATIDASTRTFATLVGRDSAA